MNLPIFAPLPYKEIIGLTERKSRVMFLDPSIYYSRVTIKPFERINAPSVIDMFPPQGKLCSCGCGAELTGRRTRWAKDECGSFASIVQSIISGQTGTIKTYLEKYYGENCSSCGCKDTGHNMGSNGWVTNIKVDHIIPVKHGGGGSWLNNYQLLCHECHVKKTKEDFGWCKPIPTNQLPLF